MSDVQIVFVCFPLLPFWPHLFPCRWCPGFRPSSRAYRWSDGLAVQTKQQTDCKQKRDDKKSVKHCQTFKGNAEKTLSHVPFVWINSSVGQSVGRLKAHLHLFPSAHNFCECAQLESSHFFQFARALPAAHILCVATRKKHRDTNIDQQRMRGWGPSELYYDAPFTL